jgi:hypothetical protein
VSRRREKRHAVREMKVGPSKPPCRGRFQTATSCYGQTAAVVNVVVKRRDLVIMSCGNEGDEWKRTADDASKMPEMTSKPGSFSALGGAWRVPTYGPCGVRCKGGVNLIRAFARNLRTWLAMIRKKAQAAEP